MQDELSNKMIDIVADETVSSAGVDLLELTLDQLTNSSIVDHLPVVGTAVATGKVALGVRDYLFARKVLSFITGLSDIPLHERQKFQKNLLGDKSARRVGLQLLEFIDKATDEYKARILGKLLSLHISNAIPYALFVRLSEMVLSAYISDLEYFKDRSADRIAESGDEVEHLLALGFYVRPKKKFGDTVMEDIQPVISDHGELIDTALS